MPDIFILLNVASITSALVWSYMSKIERSEFIVEVCETGGFAFNVMENTIGRFARLDGDEETKYSFGNLFDSKKINSSKFFFAIFAIFNNHRSSFRIGGVAIWVAKWCLGEGVI